VGVMREILVADRMEPRLFTTILAGRIDLQKRRLSCINAGHLPPLLVAGGVTSLHSHPTAPLGVETVGRWPLLHFPLPERWSLFCYTDGLIDARVAPGSSQRYGEDRLKERLSAWTGLMPGGAEVDALITEIETASGDAFADDVAILLISTADTGSAARP